MDSASKRISIRFRHVRAWFNPHLFPLCRYLYRFIIFFPSSRKTDVIRINRKCSYVTSIRRMNVRLSSGRLSERMFRDGLATILPKCRYFMVRVWHKYLMVLANNFFLYKIFNLKKQFCVPFFFLLLWHMQLKITLIKKRNNRCKNLPLCDFVEYFYVSNETAPTHCEWSKSQKILQWKYAWYWNEK